MKTSAAGRAAIAQREGNKLQAYQDSVKVWTIGVGHTAAAGDPAPKRGMTITAAQSDEILARDLRDVENDVNALVKVPMTQNQFDALVSLVFNIGGGNFRKSSVLRKINAKDYDGAAAAFMSWNKAGKPLKVLPGLTTRRDAERKQFKTPDRPGSVAADIPVPKPAPVPDASPAPAQDGTKPDIVVAPAAEPDETQVVIVKTPQNPPASHPLPSNAAGFSAFGAMLVALGYGALKYFGAV